MAGKHTKEKVLRVTLIDGELHSSKVEKRVIYHRAVPVIAEPGDYIITMGNKVPVFAAWDFKYYLRNLRSLQRRG